MEEAWVSKSSKFKFSDNFYDFRYGDGLYGTIMFAEFEQETENCGATCSYQTYFLKAKHADLFSWTSFEMKDDGIVTKMRLFYKHVVLVLLGKSYDQGIVLAGV